MISEKESVKISKFLSLVLRHQPETIGITLNEHGWTDVPVLITKMNESGMTLTMDVLEHIVDTNPKKRFAFNETRDKIRASQGHSVDIALGYEAKVPPDVLYHGTSEANVTTILQTGLQKMQRHHVHLSKDKETAMMVGQRHGKPRIFEVDAITMNRDGHLFYISENGVWLTDHVPGEYLKLI